MSTIYFGNTSQLGNYAATGTVGWNDAQGAIWGNSAADTFSFENDSLAVAAFSNQSWMFNGGGGLDTISFASYANATNINFNMGQLVNPTGTTNAFTVIGSSLNDAFTWNGGTTPSIASINGGAGTDTLSLTGATAGKQINLYDAAYTSIEMVVGSSLGDTLRGTSVAETLSGAGGADQLWGGAGVFADSLIGGAGTDTFWFYANEGDDVIGKEATTTDSANDIVKLSGMNFARPDLRLQRRQRCGDRFRGHYRLYRNFEDRRVYCQHQR